MFGFDKIGLNLRIGSKLGAVVRRPAGGAQAALATAPGHDQSGKEF